MDEKEISFCNLELSKNCENCKKTFFKKKAESKGYWEKKKCCSHACAYQFKRDAAIGFANTPMSKPCKNCSNLLHKPKDLSRGKWEKRQFCCPKCSFIFKTGVSLNTTHCKNGLHEWKEENIYQYTDKNGHIVKYCKLCREVSKGPKENWKKLVSSYNRKSCLRRLYNMTLEEYDEKLKGQDNKCAICGIKDKDLNKTMHIDHCHKTGKIRGLLCKNCNNGLGFFNDNENNLLEAYNYLLKYKR